MHPSLKVTLLLVTSVGLLACSSEAPAPPAVQDLEPVSISIGGSDYTVIRTAFTSPEGETTEGWSIIEDGLAVNCAEPTELSCASALRDFRSG